MKHLIKTLLTALTIAVLHLTPNDASGCFCIADLCCGGPLCCGEFSILVKGGVTPSSFSNRGKIWLLDGGTVVSLTSVPKFSSQFDLPWNASAEIGWNVSNRVQFFLEYAHTQANGRTHRYTTVNGAQVERTGSYVVNSGYLGARFYFDSFCDCCCCQSRAAPYVGFKAGAAAQNHVLYNLNVNGVVAGTNPYWQDQVAASGGLQLGFEWWTCSCLSIVLQGEFVGTHGLRPNNNVLLNSTLTGGVSNVNIGTPGWILAWPVTLGLRYTF